MTIRTSQGGVQKPVSQDISILWWADASEVDVADIVEGRELALEDLGLTPAGGITTDGVSSAANVTEGEVYQDWNGNNFDSSASTQAPTITYSLLEVPSVNAAPLVYHDSIITVEGDQVTEIAGSQAPSNKIFVTETLVKDTIHRTIYTNASFATRGDISLANDALNSWEVTYNVLSADGYADVIRQYRPLPTQTGNGGEPEA